MSPKINQKDVNYAAWAACDTFRGVVDPAQYKDYILVMLFLKYISDVWKDHYEEYRKQYGDDDVRIRRKLERERFVLPMAELKDHQTGEVEDRFLADFYSLYERRNAANIGELINIVLDGIEEANKVKLEGVFRNIDFNSEGNLGKTKDRNRRLKLLLEDFAKTAARYAPQPRHRGCHRQYLHLPDRAVRRRCREEGGGILHPAQGFGTGRQARRSQARRSDL